MCLKAYLDLSQRGLLKSCASGSRNILNRSESVSGSSETLVWVKYSMILCDLNLTICPRKEVTPHKRALLHVLLQKLDNFVEGGGRKTWSVGYLRRWIETLNEVYILEQSKFFLKIRMRKIVSSTFLVWQISIWECKLCFLYY